MTGRIRLLVVAAVALIAALGAVTMANAGQCIEGTDAQGRPICHQPPQVEIEIDIPRPVDPIDFAIDAIKDVVWDHTAGELLEQVLEGYIERFLEDSSSGKLITGCERGC